MTYNPTSYMPERFDDIPDMGFNKAPANQGHISELERKNRLLEEKVRYLSDPTYRKPFDAPALPSAYSEHPTDGKGVKDTGAKLNSLIEYVVKKMDSQAIQIVALQDKVSQRSRDEENYQVQVSAAVKAGEDAPAPAAHEDLTPMHTELNRLEVAIIAGVDLAQEARSALDDEYERLYRTSEFRAWADKERDKQWAAVRKAADLADIALSAIESINSKLPYPHGDENGIPFEAPVNLGRGGLDPNTQGQAEPTIREALSILAQYEVEAYKLSQLDDDQKQDYAERAARHKVNASE
ncbi:hypothetical protein [Streptomyces europaeiscabiei]|uniref:hypothetical protein n=1 Tax=Streptomyces europaeiscabiei TaxID=146819 RepID=UPI0038F7ED5F